MGHDYGMAIDAVALQQLSSSTVQPSSQPTTHPSKGSPTVINHHLLFR
jgi:hypothetical protein